MLKRRKTLHDIQVNNMEKIKLQASGYSKMDETALKLYGLSNCQFHVVRKLRSRLFVIPQVCLIVLYLVLLLTRLLLHDILYS